MNFGSSFVYVYDEPEYEVVSDEEYDEGMQVSDEESDDEEALETIAEKSTLNKRGADPNVADGASGSNFTDAIMETDKPEAPPPAPLTPGILGVRPPPPPIPSFPRRNTTTDIIQPSEPARLPHFQKKKKGHWRNVKSHEVYSAQLPQNQSGRRERRADTNVVSINFSKLIAPGHMFTGDPSYCQDCKAILSHVSKITKDNEQQVWSCEFCNKVNEIDIMEEEIPKERDVTFMLEPALSTTTAGPSGTDESLVIFCIDTSGSMCVTTEVPGRINFRGSHALSRIQRTREDQRDQYLPNQRRDVTFVSRLQAAQAAVDHQLEEMLKEHPNRRVALIAFNNEVTVIGDGKDTPVTIAGSKLTNKDELKDIGKDLKMPVSIKDTRQQLGGQVFSLEEGGATALGPTLLIAVTMAAQHPGSKVIICTDGMANVGMGRLDNDNELHEGEFYEEVGLDAASKGVTISVISIKGTDCKLVHLGKLADTTGGQVNIVDPLKLTQEFSTILADRIIATNVVATFLLHKQLFVQQDDKEESKVVRQIGNVTADTEITFEYGIRTGQTKDSSPMETDSKKEESKDNVPSTEGASAPKDQESKFKVEVPDELPFQLQIKYTDTEGATALRVLTQTKPITRDRKQAEGRTNVQVIGAHVQKSTASLALEGRYTDTRSKAMMNQRLLWRHKKSCPKGSETRSEAGEMYNNIFSTVSKLENKVNVAQKKEVALFGRTRSDSEGSDDENPVPSSSMSAPPASLKSKGFFKAKKKKAMRSRDMSDSFSVELYQQKVMKPQFKPSKKKEDSDSDEEI
ncbi:circularly permutated Ras protein 1-like [Mytilus galloprovincialis]|uniref:circularly permutated Ras protein 1-like n=1 Tax=Mytilus galloprovincialis TaxID=29158 RepID=UPI003F7C2232